MCGINGCTENNADLVARMNAVTRHRGPDGTGVWAGEGITLGNNRLAIIDLSESAAQPMRSADGRFVIAFNGEIYNFKELRSQLTGYSFASDSDTEVLLAGFAAWGIDMFARLNGIFAIALWDIQRAELFLARDRVGIKPLYIYQHEGYLAFSSEIKGLLEDKRISRRLDKGSLVRYLRLGYVPGANTLFKGITRVPAGHYVRVYEGKQETISFWKPSDTVKDLRGKDMQTAIRDTIDAAVERQLVSDRPLGVFLSGGIDSSVVLDSMSRVRSNIDTFSIGFDMPAGSENESEKSNADFLLARETARHYGTRHHELLLGVDDLQSVFQDVVWHLDEPIASSTSFAQLTLSRFAKDSVSVVLCGDGGDELFGGYPRYLLSRRMDMYQRFVPGTLRGALEVFSPLRKLNVNSGPERYALFHFIKDDVLKSLAPQFATKDLEETAGEEMASFGNLSIGDAFMRLDREWWLRDEALLRTDKMTMAASVEGRVPLLDNEVIALADRIPFSEKVSLRDTKIGLKSAFRGRLPEFLLEQPKRGWFPPGAKWLRVPAFAAFAREVLSPSFTEATRELFDWREVERMLDDHIEKRRYNLHMLLSLLFLQEWARRYKVLL